MPRLLYGYARVSTHDQDVDGQVAALTAAGCAIVRAEKVSGTSRVGRDELDLLIALARAGDVLVVTRLDRLARSAGDLYDVSRALDAKGAGLRALEQPFDTSTSTGKLLLGVLAVVAEFETNLRRDRQREGIERAKAAGVYTGRPPSKVAKLAPKIDELVALGVGRAEIGRRLGIDVSTVFRYLRSKRKPDPDRERAIDEIVNRETP